MRRRLVVAMSGLTIATLLVFAVPRAVIIISIVHNREERSLGRTATLLEQVIATRLEAGEPVTEGLLADLLDEGEHVVVTLPDGRRLEVGPQRDAGDTVVSRSLAAGGDLTLSLDDALVDEQIATALQSLVLLAGAGVLFALLMALVLSRRLAQPFLDLAGHAARIDPDGGDPAPRSKLPEAELIADALDASCARVGDLLRREREFSANASHQIRTPLSALRLRIEDVTLWPDVPDAVRTELEEALAEVDRLSATVTDLLELSRSGALSGWRRIDVRTVVTDSTDRWSDAFVAEGRELVTLPGSGHPVVQTSEQAIRQVLDVVLENALVHGRGRVEVTVEDLDRRVVVRIADEGRIDRALAGHLFERSVRSTQSRGTGIGLALAATIAEAVSGRIRLRSSNPTTFELSLSRGPFSG